MLFIFFLFFRLSFSKNAKFYTICSFFLIIVKAMNNFFYFCKNVLQKQKFLAKFVENNFLEKNDSQEKIIF